MPEFHKVNGNIEVTGYSNLEGLELRVEAIQCYNKNVSELMPGYSGGLYLVGSGTLKVKSNREITNIPLVS